MKRFVPRWVRIMRIQRDIPSNLVSAGVDRTNLRQMVADEMKKDGESCNCIRCREAGMVMRAGGTRMKKPKLFTEHYAASGGREFFISYEDGQRKCLYGFARLRIPHSPFMKGIDEDTALLRELRVFGRPLPIGTHLSSEIQHQGIGKQLIADAEEIAQDFNCKKLAVISGIGVKPYYRRLGFFDDFGYVSKIL
jgi:elongator complex protein 3